MRKTKWIVVNKNNRGNGNIKIDGTEIEKVSKFKYLGSIIIENLYADMKLKTMYMLKPPS